jgi:hypothetical protein
MLCKGATSMNFILSVAIAITLLTSALIVIGSVPGRGVNST